MKVSKAVDYVVHVVSILARLKKDKIASKISISKTLIPTSFLSEILQSLTHVGICISKKGVKGRYRLAKYPLIISLSDVTVALLIVRYKLV